MANLSNISPDWQGSTRAELRIAQEILKREATPAAIVYFGKHCRRLGDYWYWYLLSTLWVQYTGHSDLNLWKRLFKADRPNRATSLMKPDEVRAFEQLPDPVIGFRAHRPGETDWIAYTLNFETALRFASERGSPRIVAYTISKADILALFLRRGESEILVLDRRKPKQKGTIEIVEGT
jgi:hypothetical protein